ncbi:rhomboid-domain-containing protein [Xylariaceae sp. FL1272]|nr:rhomboid-domain-containing protein [Xylariaceae sp. FL1272]
MLILPALFPATSSPIGLRAIAGAARRVSTCRPALPQICLQYSARSLVGLSASCYNPRSRSLVPHTTVRTIFKFRTITRYIDLPDSYEDAEGLPFRREDLNQREVNQIFSANLPAAQANRLLKIIHGRRVAGTLDDPELARNTRQFKSTDINSALKYLRVHIPADEVLNAGLRAEDELQAIEEKAAERTEVATGQQDSPPRPQTAAEENIKLPTGRLPKKPGSDSPYGESSFDRIRAQNIAKRKVEEAKQEEERRLREEEEAKENIGTLQTQQQKPREISAYRKHYMEKATSNLEEPPEMKAWERLVPSLAMTGLVILASLAFATMYTPPPLSRRLWPDVPPAAATCLGLMGINLVGFLLWKMPPLWATLNKYMLVVAATPRAFQVVGAMFSHQSFSHLAANMAFLWFFGTRLHDEVGRGNFLALYMSCGAVGFAASLARLVLWHGLHLTTLGASGAIYGIVFAFFWMHKYDEFKILGFPPDPISAPQGLAFMGLILGLHLLPLLSRSGRTQKLDLASHFGGMAAGVTGAELIQRHMDRKARIRTERMKVMADFRQTDERTETKPVVVEVKRIAPSNR